MASFIASSHPNLLLRNPNRCSRVLPLSKSISFAKNRNLISLSSSVVSYSGGGGNGGVSDEWGEKSTWEPPGPPTSDPPKNDDEWGPETDSGKKTIEITDEWGEKADLVPEPASDPDPPKDDDEWGNGSIPATSEDAPPPEDNTVEKLRDLKQCIVDSVYGSELGFRASPEVRAEVLELVNQLEAANPNPNPVEKPELLDGNWILL